MAVIATALPVAAWSTFDYWAPDSLRATRGTVVRVPLGRRKLVGVVTAENPQPSVANDKLQVVEAKVDGLAPLPNDVLELAEFVSTYYQQPLGLVLAQIIPPL